jgi:nucleotide-binding universal stress UspA family protein
LFSRILVAVDGSESARRAFERSVYLAQRCDSRLDMIHVVLDSTYGGDSAATFQLIEDLKERGKKLLEQYKNDYDLIVMGSRGLGPFKELLLGSVSFKVMHLAKCPVMVVR